MPKFVKFYDANRVKKSYPLFRRKPIETEITNSVAVSRKGEVNIISFVGEDTKTYTYEQEYIEPVVVITVTNTNINVYIHEITNTHVTISSVEKFTGDVHIHVYEKSEQ